MEAFVLWHRTAPTAHDEDSDPAAESAWIKRVRARFEAASGAIVGPIGGAVAAIFNVVDAPRGVDAALAILDEAEKSPELTQAPRVAIGAAIGDLEITPSREGRPVEYLGGALDRAQLLANRARSGELVLDGRARESLGASYLFRRTVGTGEPSVRGHAVDREEPRIADCRRHLVHLGRAPTPTRVQDAFAALKSHADAKRRATVVVRGPAGSGARRCVAEIEFAARPPLVLRCVGIPQGLEPYGSLRAALVRAFGSGAARLSRVDSLDLAASDVLGRIARGDAIGADDAYVALLELLVAVRKDGGSPPWIVVDPAHEIDESTVEIVGRLAADERADALIVVHLRAETNLPPPIARAPAIDTIEVPRLTDDDVRAIVATMIREASSGEIARRVASTGADTPLAVVECLRAFIASGDVVRRGRSFVFRVGPRPPDARSGCVDWVAERVALLDPQSRRVLQLVAMLPPIFPQTDLEAIAIAEGADARSVERSVARLRDDRMIVTAPFIELDHPFVREAALDSMNSARRTELATGIVSRLASQPTFARATVGHFLAEAGAMNEAAHVYLDAAEAAAGSGHPRAAIRLASAAVQASPSPATRTRASALLRGVTIRIPTSGGAKADRQSIEVPAESVDSPAHVVVEAFRARDLDRIDRMVDLAIAEGASLAAADRWRALVAMLRGDDGSAEAALLRSRERAAALPSSRTRTIVAAAVFELHAGRAPGATRMLLDALAEARDLHAEDAERAILRVLGLCFRALGHPDAGARLAAAS